MSDYEDGYLAGQQAGSAHGAAKATGTLLGLGLSLFVQLVPLALRLAVAGVLAAPLLLLGLVATLPFDFLGVGFTPPRLLSMGAVAYGLFAALYWVKGVLTAWRLRGDRRWRPLLVGCVLATCVLPAGLLVWFLHRTLPAENWPFTWGLPLGLAALTYTRYRFTDDYAPHLVRWAYRLGYRQTHS